jgi:hypothetical protein
VKIGIFGKMRNCIVIFFALSAYVTSAQKVVPLQDFNNYFKSYQNGFFRQIEFQPIKNFKYGDNVVAYVDMRDNLRVFDGSAPKDVANLNTEYEVSDNLMTWKIGPTLNMWDAGKTRTLTYFANRYIVKDSIIVYEDTRFNTMNVYYKGNNYNLFAGFGTISMPVHVGENILVFQDNGNVYKVFWRGDIYELGSWNSAITFSGETDILAFNDPLHGTFAIFQNGEFLDLESFFVDKYKAGASNIVYTDLNGNLKLYEKGKVKTLSNFQPDFWDVRDSIIVWGENRIMYTYLNGERKELVRYIPEDYAIKNSTLVFRNQMGGVSCFNKDGLKDITSNQQSEYTIHGNSVLVSLFNRSFIYYTDGRIFNL